jgi:hypothetical protein
MRSKVSATDSGITVPEQRVMRPQERLTVTLEAQQWNAVMALLAEGPYRISAPLITEIQRQCMAAGADTRPSPLRQVPASPEAAE